MCINTVNIARRERCSSYETWISRQQEQDRQVLVPVRLRWIRYYIYMNRVKDL